MSKKCNSCGAELADDVVFCDKCGAKQEAASAATATADAKPGMSKNSIIMIAGIAAAAVVVIIILCSLILGGGYKKAVKAEINAFNKEDAKKIIKTLPDDVLDAYDDKTDDYEDYLSDVIDSRKDMYKEEKEIGKDAKITYDIKDTIKLTDDQLDEISDTVEKLTDEELDVTKGYSVILRIKVKGKDGSKENFTTMTICKVDGKWMVVSGGLVSRSVYGDY